MKTSVIRYRVADFLKQHAPFDALPEDDLLELAASGRVTFHERDECLHEAGQAVGTVVRVIQQGRVELLDSAKRLSDVLGEGDLLGFERLLDLRSYIHSARTTSDVILYAIDAKVCSEVIARRPSMRDYLAAHLAPSMRAGTGGGSWMNAAAPPRGFPRSRRVSDGVLIVPCGLDAADYVLRLMRARTEELAVADDEGAFYVITREALALACGRDPGLVHREMLAAESTEVLGWLRQKAATLLADGLQGPALVERCAAFALEFHLAAIESTARLAAPEASGACWLLFGEAARGEVLTMDAPEAGIVYNDSGAREQFEAIACTAGVAPERCLSLEAWKDRLTGLIEDPILNDLYGSRDLFDFRFVCGDAALAADLASHTRDEIGRSASFLPILANDAMARVPPMAFFDGLVIETDGASSGTLDLDATARTPIADAARVLAIAHGELDAAGTLTRLERAASAIPESAAVLREAAEAYRVVSYHLSRSGRREVAPAALDKYDQRTLKTAFNAVRRLLEYTYRRFDPAAAP